MIWSLVIITGFLAAWIMITRRLRDTRSRRFALAGMAIAHLLPLLHLAFQVSGIGWQSPSIHSNLDSLNGKAWMIDSLIGIWIFGTAVSIALLGYRLLSIRRLIRTARLPDESVLQLLTEIPNESDINFNTRLKVTNALASPCVVGIFDPIILVPISSKFWSTEIWRCVLAHETTHLTGHDTLWRLVSAILRCIWWFHPLVYLLTKQAESACEEVCDAAVIERGIAPRSYAECLIDMADNAISPTPAIAAFASPSGTGLSRRIARILSSDQTTNTSKFVFLFAAITLGSSIVVAAKHQIAPTPLVPDALTSEAVFRLNAEPFPAE